MSVPSESSPAKLVISLISPDDENITRVCEELSKLYGKIDFTSDLLSFHHTDYYYQEMGFPLWRRFISFKDMISKRSIPFIKLKTNEMEKMFSTSRGKRRVNIDPGYLSLENLILATGKNFIHRIYLDQGIYADLTLVFKGGSFKPLPWTYPDYAGQDAIEIFNGIREKCHRQIKSFNRSKDVKEYDRLRAR